MNAKPAPPAPMYPLADGVVALAAGFALLSRSRVLLVADAHFGYEDLIGGGAALPVWSTAEMAAAIAIAARQHAVREIVFLGDVIHGSGLSGGAGRAVAGALAGLREIADLTFVAGNHEGPTRGTAILGPTVEACDRDGWLLVHGDRPGGPARRTVIGHLHPSLHLGGGASAPAFVGSERVIVVPALTPYSRGLDILSAEFLEALGPWGMRPADVQVVAAAGERVFPFGTLAALHGALSAPGGGRRPGLRRRRRLERG